MKRIYSVFISLAIITALFISCTNASSGDSGGTNTPGTSSSSSSNGSDLIIQEGATAFLGMTTSAGVSVGSIKNSKTGYTGTGYTDSVAGIGSSIS
jgi:hypothetical protein